MSFFLFYLILILLAYIYFFNLSITANPFNSTRVYFFNYFSGGCIFTPPSDGLPISENQGALGPYSGFTRELYIAYFQELLLNSDNLVDLLNASLVNKSSYVYLFNYGNTIGERNSSYPAQLSSLTFYNLYIPHRYVDNLSLIERNICVSHFYGSKPGTSSTEDIKNSVLFKYAPELFDRNTSLKWFKRLSRVPKTVNHVLNNDIVSHYLSNNPGRISGIAKFDIQPDGTYTYDLVGEAKLYYDSIIVEAVKRGSVKVLNSCFFYDNCLENSRYFSERSSKFYTDQVPKNSSTLALYDQIKLFIQDKRVYSVHPNQFCNTGYNESECGIRPFSGDRFVPFLKSREVFHENDIRTWSNNFIKTGPLSNKLDRCNLHSDYNAQILRNYNVSRLNSLSKDELMFKDSSSIS